MNTENRAPCAALLLRLWRLFRLTLHFIWGAWIVAVLYPRRTLARQRILRQRWSRDLLSLLGVEWHCVGDVPVGRALVVANHISWLDIFVLNACTPVAFVSKSEVRRWPLVGWLAARNDTLFVRRGDRSHIQDLNSQIAAKLGQLNVAVFPEGTTTDGATVLAFHSALLQSAVIHRQPLQPMAIGYCSATGERSIAAAYDGDLSLGESLWRVVSAQSLQAHVVILAPLTPETIAQPWERRSLAQQSHCQIAEAVAQMYVAPESEPCAAPCVSTPGL